MKQQKERTEELKEKKKCPLKQECRYWNLCLGKKECLYLAFGKEKRK